MVSDFLFSALERVANAVLPKFAAQIAAPDQPQTVASPSVPSTAGTATPELTGGDERVARIQRFLEESELPQYAPGTTDGIWDERTRRGVIAFLQSNYKCLNQFASLAMAPDFASFDKEGLLATMSGFVMPQERT